MTSLKDHKASTGRAECWALKTCLKPLLESQVPGTEMPSGLIVIEEAAVERYRAFRLDFTDFLIT